MFATLLLLAFVGCSANKNSGEVAVVEVNPLATDVIPLSSFVKDVEFVSLELTDDSVIKRVNELFFYVRYIKFVHSMCYIFLSAIHAIIYEISKIIYCNAFRISN